MNLQEALKHGEEYLAACGIDDASVDAWLLLEYVTGITRTRFLLDRGQEMQEADRIRYRELLEKRGVHIPLQHLTGVQEFMGLEFQVNEHVLIPRQDTEILVEEAMKYLRPGMRVLDLCTGSGCIGISLAKLWPGGAWKCKNSDVLSGLKVIANEQLSQMQTSWKQDAKAAGKPLAISVDCADISLEALKVAQGNADKLDAAVRLIHSDLFESLDKEDGCEAETAVAENRKTAQEILETKRSFAGAIGVYDMIVSNPPYIQTSVIEGLSEEVRLHEPFGALDGKEDGLYFYRKIIRESRAHLCGDGWLLFEIGYDQGEAVSQLMKENGFADPQVVKDLAGLDRVVYARSEKN